MTPRFADPPPRSARQAPASPRASAGRALIAVVVALAGVVAAQQPAAPRAVSPVTDAMLQKPDRRRLADVAAHAGHVGLQSARSNRPIERRHARAGLVARALEPGIQEGTPLVHDGVMFMPNPLDVIQAIDAATGDLIWEYRRQLPDDLGKSVPFPAINRNLAIYGNTHHRHQRRRLRLRARRRHRQAGWETRDPRLSQNAAQQTSGPIIANGKVISGRGCEPEGGPEACVITAHDAKTGKELWRTRTIPKPGEPGDETWGNVPYESRWHVGTWMVPSYDPELNLIYIGTSVTSPAPKFMLGGQRQQLPLSQLDARAEMPTPARSSGTTSTRRSLGS